MRRVTADGVRVRRARIVSEPVSDYIRFEWHGGGPSVEAGKDLRWLLRRLASGIALPGNDFWLLDERSPNCARSAPKQKVAEGCSLSGASLRAGDGDGAAGC